MLEKIVQIINASDANSLKLLLRKKGAKRFIHRQLFFRLFAVAGIISIFLTALIFLLEYKRLGNLVNERAVEIVSNFNDQIQQIGHTIGDNEEEIQQELKMLLIAGKSGPWAGQLVYSSIYDLSGKKLGAAMDSKYQGSGAVNQLVASIETKSHEKTVKSESVRRIKGTPYIHLRYPLYDQSGKVTAFIQGIFQVSAQVQREVKERITRTILAAISTVLLTTIILYPVMSRLIHQLTILTGNLVESNIETLRVIGSAIAKRDSDTDSHNYRVTIYSVELAEQIGLKPNIIQGLIKGAFLHDVGKIGISDQILLKPDKLSEDEYEIMKLHVQHGIDIVQQSGWLRDAIDVVKYHHEKYAGNGYPEGLRGPEIPVNARIFAIVDVFDALTSKRPYKEQISFEKSMEMLNEDKGDHFDPALLEIFNEIARSLYDQFTGGTNKQLIKKMEAIVLKYFSKEYRYETDDDIN